MPHTTRENYKAKWLNALAGVETSNVAITGRAVTAIQSAATLSVNASIDTAKIHDAALNAMHAAIECLEILDENRNISGIELPEVKRNVDMHASKQTVVVMLRRVRDTLTLSAERLMLHRVIFEKVDEQMASMEENIKYLENQTHVLQEQFLESAYIGKGRTASERENFLSRATAGKTEVFEDSYYEDYVDDEPTFSVRERRAGIAGTPSGKGKRTRTRAAPDDSASTFSTSGI